MLLAQSELAWRNCGSMGSAGHRFQLPRPRAALFGYYASLEVHRLEDLTSDPIQRRALRFFRRSTWCRGSYRSRRGSSPIKVANLETDATFHRAGWRGTPLS